MAWSVHYALVVFVCFNDDYFQPLRELAVLWRLNLWRLDWAGVVCAQVLRLHRSRCQLSGSGVRNWRRGLRAYEAQTLKAGRSTMVSVSNKAAALDFTHDAVAHRNSRVQKVCVHWFTPIQGDTGARRSYETRLVPTAIRRWLLDRRTNTPEVKKSGNEHLVRREEVGQSIGILHH